MNLKVHDVDHKGHQDYDAGMKLLKDTEAKGMAMQKELDDMKKLADAVMKKEADLDQRANEATQRIKDLAASEVAPPTPKSVFLEVPEQQVDLQPAVQNFESAA